MAHLCSGWPKVKAGFFTDKGDVYLDSLQHLGDCGPDPELRSMHY